MFCTFSVSAQTYQTIVDTMPKFFERLGSSPYGFSFRVTGLNTISSDSIFSLNKSLVVAPTFQECNVSVEGSSAMGSSVVKRNNWNILINALGDSIYFKTSALLGDSWQFCSSSSTIYTAYCSAVILENVNGLVDSVKVITITGSPEWNGKTFELSKSSGLVRTSRLLDFPADTNRCYLASKNLLTYAQVNNFNIGDKIGYHFWSSYPGPGQYETWTFLSKSTLADTAIYSVEVDRTYGVVNPGNPPSVSWYDTLFVTTKKYYVGSDHINKAKALDEPFPGYDSMPTIYSFSSLGFQACNSVGMEQRFEQTIYCFDTVAFTMDCTANSCFTSEFEPSWKEYKFYYGLGTTVNDENPASFYYLRQDITGYKKGSIICGSFPVSTLKLESYKRIEVYPNPASVSVTFGQKGWEEFEIYSVSGSVIAQGSIDQNAIDISSIQPGTYFLRLKNDSKSDIQRFVIAR